jgi:hypothetical protein
MSRKIHESLDLNPDADGDRDYDNDPRPIVDLVVYTDPQESAAAMIAADFDHVRDNMYDIIDQGRQALVDMAEIAKQSQDPKMYDTMVNVLKATIEGNKALMDLHKTKKDLVPAAEQLAPQTINNNLFLTTEELNKMLEDARAKKGQ